MTDARLLEKGITAHRERRWRLTGDAVQRIMARHGVPTVYALAARLGFSKQTFWRLRAGTYDLRMSDVAVLAAAADLQPLDALTELFEAVDA